ncbi:uncharacterized protein LOC124817169 [Hydra vulgaris]|uniref:uncharacterized protein LOC124817169 n=1 Tax=Hydra vulgaris TaxID=6087 RepID=UPI0032EA7813
MSLSKLFAGRKRNSSVWKWFKYDASSDKSVCLVLLDGEKVCNTKLCGKNPTNLKLHLARNHKSVHVELEESELKKLSEKKQTGIKRKAVDENGPTLLESSSNQNQTLIQCINRRNTAWPINSHEHKIRLNSLIQMIIATCNPVTLVDNASFRKLVNTLDYKFSLPASAKITSLLNEEFTVLTRKLRDFISEGRRFTVCLDGWTKKGLTASFLGISVCFFHFKSEKPIHALLNLYLVKHPRTGEQIANCFEKCLKY